MTNEVISVDGMTCQHCKMTVEKAVSALTGVRGAEVDLESKNVSVDFDGDAVDRGRIEEAIKTAGYTVV